MPSSRVPATSGAGKKFHVANMIHAPVKTKLETTRQPHWIHAPRLPRLGFPSCCTGRTCKPETHHRYKLAQLHMSLFQSTVSKNKLNNLTPTVGFGTKFPKQAHTV
jgi:hypothetical protein